MEIEMKYSIPDENIIEKMWTQEVFEKYGSVDRNTVIQMAATYYDTAEGLLSSVDAAFRTRKEGNHFVATLKWNDSVHDGLFEREELNINIEEAQCHEPTLQIFAESENTRPLINLVEDRPLYSTIETDFIRHVMRVDTGSVIFEADLDIGSIIAGEVTLPICELELELYSGSIEAMEKVGMDLAERFGLVPGVKSKFQRGLEALDKATNRTGV